MDDCEIIGIDFGANEQSVIIAAKDCDKCGRTVYGEPGNIPPCPACHLDELRPGEKYAIG